MSHSLLATYLGSPLICIFGNTVVLLLFILLVLSVLSFFLIKGFLRKKQGKTKTKESSSDKERIQEILVLCKDRLNEFVVQMNMIYSTGIDSFLGEDITRMKVAIVLKKQLNKNQEKLKKELFSLACELESSIHSGHYYVELNDYQNRMVHSLNLLIQPLYEHLNNSHKPFVKPQEEELKDLEKGIVIFFSQALSQMNDHMKQMGKLAEMQYKTTELLESMELAQIQRIKSKQVNTRNSILFLNTITETRNMLNYTLGLVKTFRKIMMA